MTRSNKLSTMKRIFTTAALVAGFSLGGAASALAQDQPQQGGVDGYQKVKSYDFSGDTIDGDLVKPDSELVNARKFAAHTSLIRIRQDFLREILKSAEDL